MPVSYAPIHKTCTCPRIRETGMAPTEAFSLNVKRENDKEHRTQNKEARI